MEQGNSNFKIYEGNNDFYGMAEATLPEVGTPGDDISGSGLSGTFKGIYPGHVEAMSMALNFRTINKHLITLVEPRNHTITLMSAQKERDNNTGTFKTTAIKHVVVGTPTKFAAGKLAPAASTESSVEFSITYFATYIGGKKMIEIDIFNNIYIINGVDYLADERKALGM
ncbi:hypothetical protein FACS189425_06240 [Clostridia bacterium]|nr:hypothetical protein FACS189425_06240 [Clostridia bacterium]